MPARPDLSRAARPPHVAALSAAWTRFVANPSAMIVASAAAQSALRLASNVVLARLLTPGIFALTALATLVMTSIHMISDVGIAITALRVGDMSRGDEDRLWTMQAVRGVGMAVVIAIAGIPVGWIYHDNQLREILFALALTALFDGAKSLFPVLALAHRRLGPTTVVELGGRVVAIVVSVAVAIVSPTVWSLVIGLVVSSIFSTVVSHLSGGRPPRFVFDADYIRRQWRISRWIQASSTLTFAGQQVDKAVFPFLFGLPPLGLYGIAASFATIPSQVTSRWSGSVFYPLAVRMLRGDPAARARLMAVRTTMLLYTFVGTLALMAVSPAFFHLLYPARYHAAAGIATILGATTFFETTESSLRHFPLVEDTPQFELWAVFVRLAAFAVLVPLSVLLGGGVAGYALSYVGGLAVGHLFMLAIDVRRGYLRPWFDLALIAALAAAGTAIYLLPLERLGPLALIGEAAAVALAAAAAMLVIYWRRGLPSLPADPAPQVLAEVAEHDLVSPPPEP